MEGLWVWAPAAVKSVDSLLLDVPIGTKWDTYGEREVWHHISKGKQIALNGRYEREYERTRKMILFVWTRLGTAGLGVSLGLGLWSLLTADDELSKVCSFRQNL